MRKRIVNFDMNGLLERLGYLNIRYDRVHYESSTCYISKGGDRHFTFDLEINPSEYTEGAEVDLERYREIRSRIVQNLGALRIKDSGRPIFGAVDALDGAASDEDPDIRTHSTEAILEMPDEGTMIVGAGQEILARELVYYHPWSGRHRVRGIFLARGPMVKHRYTGAWAIDDPYTSMFRYGRGIFRLTDRFSTLFRTLHLVDEITTLDFAPTVLYLAGLPVARDMDGRIMSQIITGDYLKANAVEMVASYEKGNVLKVERDKADVQKIRERLKALGYIQ
jgi:hypothetical protein